jgi:radical SAM superfamily enzyme YgiQ (UPF0313 family)
MRVLLISENKSRLIMPIFPLGITYRVANIDPDDDEIKVLDLMFLKKTEVAIKEVIEDFNPDLIGLSLRNIDNQSYFDPYSFLPEIKHIVQICRETSSAKIVLGGPGFSTFPESSLQYLKADLGIIGEGEETFNQLLLKIKEQEDYKNLAGLLIREQGKIISNPPQFIKDFDNLKIPDRTFFNNQRYAQEVGTAHIPGGANIQSKRGCPFKCIYCSVPNIEGRSVRLRSPKKVVDELEIIRKELGIQRIFFVDALFNCPIEHAESICEEIIKRGLDIHWHATLTPLLITERLIRLMKKAGCSEITLGIESGSSKMLKNLGKNYTVENIKQSFKYCKDFEITNFCYLLLGGPGEDKKTIEESISFTERIQTDFVNLTIGIRICPGCRLADIAENEGFISTDQDLLTPTFYLSPQLKANQILDYATKACKRNKGWMLPINTNANHQ